MTKDEKLKENNRLRWTYRVIFVILLSVIYSQLVYALDTSSKKDHSDKIALLNKAVIKHDVAATKALLRQGVDPRKQTKGGATPLKSALLAVTGNNPDVSIRSSSQLWDYDDPKLVVMRDVMSAVRNLSSYVKIDVTGTLEITVESTAFDPKKGRTFVTTVSLVTPSRKLELVLSTWETEYINISIRNSNPSLNSGETYRVIGAEKDGIVSVYKMRLVGSQSMSFSSMNVPIYIYLLDTFKEMQANTWVK